MDSKIVLEYVAPSILVLLASLEAFPSSSPVEWYPQDYLTSSFSINEPFNFKKQKVCFISGYESNNSY